MSKQTKKKKTVTCVLLAIVYILSIGIAVMATTVSQRTKYESKIEELTENHEQEIAALQDELQTDYNTKIAELKAHYEYGGDITQIEREAEYIAKVIYGMARNHADSDKKAVVWCILNRVEHHSHPNNIAGVCEQPNQWIGYSSDNPVLDELYDLALSELKTWYSGGHRPMGNEYVYLSWSSKEILLRDTFEENRNTRYWRMK